MFKKEDLSESEKIDKIYSILKAQHRNSIISGIFSWTIRLIILYGIFVLYGVFVQDKSPELKQKIISPISEVIKSVAQPIINDFVDSNLKQSDIINLEALSTQITGSGSRKKNISKKQINQIIEDQLKNLSQ